MARVVRKRIFVLENDPEYGKGLKAALRRAGFSPELCAKRSNAPQVKILCTKGFALALVDRKAEKDTRKRDDSGLKYALAIQKRGCPAVLVTAFPEEAQQIFERLRAGELTGIVSKNHTQVDTLITCLKYFFSYGVFPNGVAKFQWMDDPPNNAEVDGEGGFLSESWGHILRQLGKDPDDEVLARQLEVLLRTLISPCATVVRVKNGPSQGQSGNLVMRAEVTCVDGPVAEQLMLKIGQKQAIRSEMLRYDRFVGPLPDGACAQLRWRSQTEHLAAIAYSFVGDSVEEGVAFSNLAASEDHSAGWRRRHDATRRLFGTALHGWHKVYREESGRVAGMKPKEAARAKCPVGLLDYYLGHGGPWYEGTSLEKIQKECLRGETGACVKSDGKAWVFQDCRASLKDPISWLKEQANRLQVGVQMPTHGDLHVGNIFVLPDDSPRLIDFGRTDLGHVFRDFAALEASIRMTCVGTPDRPSLCKAEEILTDAEELDSSVFYDGLGDSDDLVPLREGLHITQDIRRAARDACGAWPPEKAMVEYLTALIVHLLKYATGEADECPNEHKKNTEALSLEIEARQQARIWHAHYAAAMAATTAEALRKRG